MRPVVPTHHHHLCPRRGVDEELGRTAVGDGDLYILVGQALHHGEDFI